MHVKCAKIPSGYLIFSRILKACASKILSSGPTTFKITGTNSEVLQGTDANLTCSVTEILYPYSETTVSIDWIGSNGVKYNDSSSYPGITVIENNLQTGGKTSTMTISGEVTEKVDQLDFTCNATVGNETFDIVTSLKIFRVQTDDAEVELGQVAILTCSVVGHTNPLQIRWFLHRDSEKEGIQTEIQSPTGTSMTTISQLILEKPTHDATYTCQVSGPNIFTHRFDVQLMVNDIMLNPNSFIRAFEGTEVALVCSFQSDSFWDGLFDWSHNGLKMKCTGDNCSERKDTPISSTLSLTITEETEGEWTCSFTKKSSSGTRKMTSSPLQITRVDLRGAQSPAVMWGRVGDVREVSCRVPIGLNYSDLTVLEWTLNGYLVREGRSDPTQTLFTFGEKIQEDTLLSCSITFIYSIGTAGELRCKAMYSSGEELQISSSQINRMSLTFDKESVIVTPTGEAEVTFVTRAEERPTTSVTFPGGSSSRHAFIEESNGKGGMIYKEEIIFSIDHTNSEVHNKDDLGVQEFQYKYTVNSGLVNEMQLTGTVILVGKTYVDPTPVWAVVGEKVKLTVYFTALDLSQVKVSWERQYGSAWNEIVSSTTTKTFLTDLKKKNTMSTTLIVDKMSESLTNAKVYRARIEVSGNIEISGPITVKVSNTSYEDVKPVFEGEDVSFSFTILSGPSKVTSIALVHVEGGREYQLEIPDSPLIYPWVYSSSRQVFSCDRGYYFLRVVFKTGLKLETKKVMFEVKQRCRPLKAPPNTILSEVDDLNSNNYRVTVTCKNGDEEYGGSGEEKFAFMDETRTEIWCDTSTGTYSSEELTPCVKVL